MPRRDPSRILLIRPSALGDVCRTVPVLSSLRRAFPEAEIDWLVQDSFVDAVRWHPGLTRAIPFPRALLGRSSRRGRLGPTWRWMNAHLRPRPRYDLVIDAQGLFRSGLFAWWTGSASRVGYANAAEMGWAFLNRTVRVDRARHAVDRMLALMPLIGVEPVRDMALHADPGELAWVDGQPWGEGRPAPVARDPGSSALGARTPYAVLAPTSRWPGKQWPAERFAELGRRLLARGASRIVLVGGPGEREQIAPLVGWAAGEPRVVDLVGETSIARLMAVIARSSLVVANDSAALHMAVGFARPLVALFGPTRVNLVGPFGRDADVIQHAGAGDSFDHKDAETGRAMMERIAVEEVVEASLVRTLTPHAKRLPRA